MSNTSPTITGVDGKIPIDNPNGLFHIWALAEVFMGANTPGANRYVPKVRDRVIDLDTNDWYSVESVDPTTFVPELKLIKVIPEGVFSPNDILLGVGPGTPSDTYRIYIDKSVVPYTLCVDARLKVAGSAANSAIIYTGSQLDGSAIPVSAIYDQSGNLLGQNIPLELVAMQGGTNIAIKTVAVCHTNANLLDGEIVTAVFYSANGNVVSKRQLLVENTAFIRTTDSSVKYITGISLESPFLSQSDNSLILYPINVPLESLMLTGVVTYSDGSVMKLPVDGTRFSIFGFAGYVATIVGQKFNLVLKYTLSPGEVVYGSQNINQQIGGQFITNNYKAITLKTDGSFSVKLYAFPIWANALNGYVLQWYLYTLDRKVMYNVTPWVGYNHNSASFNPTSYGVKQTLSVYVDLKDVNATFANYRNVQTIDVTLVAPNQNPQFGLNNFAASVATPQQGLNLPPVWQVSVAAGSTSLTEWLNRMYFATLPLMDPISEVAPPTPNMFSLMINGQDLEFPISAWNSTITIPSALPDTTTLFIKFFLRTNATDLQLSICALPVYGSNGYVAPTNFHLVDWIGAAIPPNGNNAGSGYSVDDVLTAVGGTFTRAATFRVDSNNWINSGGFGGATIIDGGDYTVTPNNPISLTGGTGTGATISGTFVAI